MNALHRAWLHVTDQPFIAATGFAALVHSTWSIGTLFSGAQPAPPPLTAEAVIWLVFAVQTLAWHVPALAIAFALDVGQIVTSHSIALDVQAGAHPWKKYVTFVVFAVATYYMQWLYCAHHMPQLALGAGVAPAHVDAANGLRDAAVWIVPLFLPLSTLMYTFSHSKVTQPAHAPTRVQVSVEAVHVDALPAPMEVEAVQPVVEHAPAAPRSAPSGNYTGEANAAVVQQGEAFVFTCPDCNKVVPYASRDSAVKGASAHLGRYCAVRHAKPVVAVHALPVSVVSSNGKHSEVTL